MDKLEYQVVMHRIQEIEQEQLSCLDYVCDKIDFMVDVQKDNVRERMLQLQEEKKKLIDYINKKAPSIKPEVNLYFSYLSVYYKC